jgi:uncharacterized membrane protein YhdT
LLSIERFLNMKKERKMVIIGVIFLLLSITFGYLSKTVNNSGGFTDMAYMLLAIVFFVVAIIFFTIVFLF